MNIIQSVRCVTITAHSSTYGLSNTRYIAAATAAAHYLYIRPYDGKMSTKATMPVRMTPHNHTYTLREQQTSNVSLSTREYRFRTSIYETLFLSECARSLLLPDIFEHRIEWKSDDHALEWRINNVFICVDSWQHRHTQPLFKQKQNNRTHVRCSNTSTSNESIEFISPRAFHCWYVKVRNDFVRWEKENSECEGLLGCSPFKCALSLSFRFWRR